MINLAATGRRFHAPWLAVVVWMLVAASAGRGAPPAARLEREEAARVVFRVVVPEPVLLPGSSLAGTERLELGGYDPIGTPGGPPSFSRVFFVALPPEGAYSLSFRVISSTPLGTHRLEPVPTPIGIHDPDMGPGLSERVVRDEDVYRAYRDPAVVAGEAVVYIRHQRALPVRVSPVSYDPATEELAVAREIEVDVRFAAPRERSGVDAPSRAGRMKDVYGRLFVNAGQLSRWSPERPLASAASAAAARAVAGAVKVRVYNTGMHTVRASRAITAGFPAGTPLAQLRVFRRAYDDATLAASETNIAFDVNEAASGTPGIFDGADEVVFYARRLRDDSTQGDTRENYASYNVYWLEPSAGTRMAVRTPPVGFVTADTALAAFPVTRRFETDSAFREGTPNEQYDIYYQNSGSEAGPVDMPFTLDYIQPGTSLSLGADLHGQTYDARNVRLSLFNSKGDRVLNAFYPMPLKTRRNFTATIAAADLDPGANQFRISRPDNSRSSLQVLGNYVDVTYNALYRARGNALRFNSASLAGDTSLTVTGITSTAGLELFDITDAFAPARLVLAAGHFQPADGGTALSFRDNVGGPRREYLLVPGAGMTDVASADLVADAPSAIIGGAAENGVDALVVSHRDFLSAMGSWVSYRRAQGYRVLLVDVDDVFDEFNGGVPNPRAVYRFARHFFEHADASALLLVGDASVDHRRMHPDSGPDLVPTFHRVDNVSQLSIDEVVTADKRLVKFPAPGGAVDAIPDMIFGRIPVGDAGELQTVLGKIYAYEAPSPSDFWRKRMVLVADDRYSEGEAAFGGLRFDCHTVETGFEDGQEEVARTIEGSLPAGYDLVRFYLRNYTSAFYPPCDQNNPGGSANRSAAISYTRQNVTERFMNELNQGATWVAIQSHMNRYVITHERLFTGEPASLLNSPTGRDHLRVENRFKPWIIFGMGCHFSEYAVYRELATDRALFNSPNGDAMAEQLLFQDERGAVGTYGSSGFEFLDQNRTYMNRTAQVWFYDAPYDTMVQQTQAEWKLGELMYLTEAQMAPQQPQQVERYLIIGDPLLRVDAGPPKFEVTVNGRPAQSGDLIGGGGELDSIRVVAVVTDENAIHRFALEIDGQDLSDSLTVVPLTDPQLPHARQYRVGFHHMVAPRTYDIILRAYQAPDTTAGQYHMAAEFVLKVESSIKVAVNGREIQSGAAVPADGNYRVDLAFPVFIPSSDITVTIDSDVVTDAQFTHPAPEDSLAWIITFRRKLAAGAHQMRINAQDIEFVYELRVSETAGLDHVINFPNPFGGDGTRFVYTNEVEITGGNIDIYTVSGKKVRRLEIPSTARLPGQNSVFWDGRDGAGGALGNGVYLFVINVKQRTGSATARGSLSKIE